MCILISLQLFDRYLEEQEDHSLIPVVKALLSQPIINSLTIFDFLLINCRLRARSVPSLVLR